MKPTFSLMTGELNQALRIIGANMKSCDCANCKSTNVINQFAAMARALTTDATEFTYAPMTVETPKGAVEYPLTVTVKAGAWTGSISLNRTPDVNRVISEHFDASSPIS